MKDPEVPVETDYLVLESTYGNRLHERVDAMEALGEAIEKCIERRGTVVIPAFAVGRAQTLLFHLSRLRKAGRLRGVPVYLDSPMAISASRIFCRHLGDHRLTPEQCEETCDVPQYVRDVESSKQISRSHEPKIIISASGMATGGRVVHHIKQFAPDPRNLILFAGFQAAGTRGARMVEGARSLKIHGEQIPLNAEVANLPMLSGHADADEIMRWISAIKKPPRMTFITHGESTASEALRQRIEKELGWKCKIPVQGERVILA
jgi:metallo-beta-lactamase family protein